MVHKGKAGRLETLGSQESQEVLERRVLSVELGSEMLEYDYKRQNVFFRL